MRPRRLLLHIARLDGGDLILDGEGLTHVFFATDPSSVGTGSYDSLAGRGAVDRIELADIVALNRTMRARSPHTSWAGLIGAELAWLRDTPPDLDLIETDESSWARLRGDGLVHEAIRSTIGPGRGVSVVTKLLHLKRPRLFPVLDAFVAQLLGQPNVPDSPLLRAEQAARLVVHLRHEGRRNADVLGALRGRLAAEGYERSLVRILDAALWLAHPAAGGPGARRRFTVELLPASADG